MFGGPPVRVQKTVDRDPVGDYKLTHKMSEIGEQLFATPDQIVDLGLPCPACGGALVGKANKYTRSITVRCERCSFRVSR